MPVVKLIVRNAEGQTNTATVRPGDKFSAVGRASYKITVDDQPGLPVGTRIGRKGNDLIIQLPDGQQLVIADWCSIGSSTLTELGGKAQVMMEDGVAVPADSIQSGSCLVTASAGASGGVLGDYGAFAASAPASTTAAAPAAADGGSSALWAGLGVLALAAAAGSGSSSSSGDAAPGTPPVAGAPDLIAANDSGASDSDNITNNKTPSFTVPAPAAGQTYSLYVNGTKVASTFDAATNTLQPTAELADGTYQITYTLTTGASESAPSPALGITVDTGAPGVAASVASAENASNGAINGLEGADGTVLSVGVPADASVGDTLVVTIGSQTVTYTVAAGNPGTVVSVPITAATLVAIGDGVTTATVAVRDIAGNSSSNATLPLEIDLTPPVSLAAAGVTAPEAAGGGIDGLEVQNGTTFLVAVPAGAQVGDAIKLSFAGQDIIQFLTAGQPGTSVTVPIPSSALAGLADGSTNPYRVELLDAAGNVSGTPVTGSVVVDRRLPLNLSGTDGDDTLTGAIGGDTISGGNGADTIAGGEGNDTLYGDSADGSTAGNDIVRGGPGLDTLVGGPANDQLIGGADADVLRGDGGDDYFVFDVRGNEANDTVVDFSRVAGNNDVILLANVVDLNTNGVPEDDLNVAGQNLVSFEVIGGNLVMRLGAGGSQSVVTFTGQSALFTGDSASTLAALLSSGAIDADSASFA
jgi:Ca2+-binding RTX toxin-like protein